MMPATQRPAIQPGELSIVYMTRGDFLPCARIESASFADPWDLGVFPMVVKQRDMVERTRKPLAEFVFGEKWGSPARFVTTN